MSNESKPSGAKLIFACSGAADVGEVADQAARKLMHDGKGRMFCLAGVGGRVEKIMKATAAAETILAIDGCPENCVESCLAQAGIKNFQHLQIADLGLDKGETPVNPDAIAYVAGKAAELLG